MLLQASVMALVKIPPNTKMGQIISKFMTDLGKELSPDAMSATGGSDQMKKMALQQMQNAPQRAAMQTRTGQPPQPGMA